MALTNNTSNLQTRDTRDVIDLTDEQSECSEYSDCPGCSQCEGLSIEECLYEDLEQEDIDSDISYNDFFERYIDLVPACASEYSFYEFWSLRKWGDAFPIYGYESSYLPMATPEPSGPGYFDDYDELDPHDLKQFVKQRGFVDPFPAGTTLKFFYVRALYKADKEYRFRFLDLPSEMRLAVYRELLHVSPKPWDETHPTILRTCKEIYAEAKTVLYDDNIFEISFEATNQQSGKVRTTAQVHRDIQQGGCGHAQYLRIPLGIDDYPVFLRRTSHLKVTLRYEVEGDAEETNNVSWALNNYLYTLASFLMDGHKLKVMTLRFDVDPKAKGWAFESVLFPLLRLRNVPNFTITSELPSHIRDHLSHELGSIEPTFNTMRQYKLLQDEASAQLSVLEATGCGFGCECGECYAPSEAVAQLCYRMDHLEEAKRESAQGSREEENFIARLSILRKTLRGLDVVELKSSIKRLLDSRAQTRNYESITDVGRLEEAGRIWAGTIFDAIEPTVPDDRDWHHESSGCE